MLIMHSSLKICNKVTLKTEKDYEAYKKREELYINGTPKILLGKANILYQ